ncbi:MAG TPA: hypothetical protein VHG35_04390 [Gemmatimonadales bacterium]|nr:hypothetical protein [Gemmatimonadales bacterium]
MTGYIMGGDCPETPGGSLTAFAERELGERATFAAPVVLGELVVTASFLVIASRDRDRRPQLGSRILLNEPLDVEWSQPRPRDGAVKLFVDGFGPRRHGDTRGARVCLECWVELGQRPALEPALAHLQEIADRNGPMPAPDLD